MPEDKKEFSPGFPNINTEITKLFERLEKNRDPKENHELEEMLGELKIGHKEEALKLLRYYKFRKEAVRDSKKQLDDELEMILREIKVTENILNNPKYEKEWDVYRETLAKRKKELDELQGKIEQAKSAAADLPNIEEIEKKLEESE